MILTGKAHLSNKTQALTKSANMDIWLIGTLNQLSRGFYNRIEFQKFQLVRGKSPFLQIPYFAFPTLFVLALAFDRAVLYGNVAFSIMKVL